MALDATYDHLLRLLSNRGLGWLRDRIQSLPNRLSLYDPDTLPLARTARLAPVLSGLRGSPSPLVEIALQRMDVSLAMRIIRQAWRPAAQPDRTAVLLAGAAVAANESPLWQLARQNLIAHPPIDLAERLDLADTVDPVLIAEIEELLVKPIPYSQLNECYIDLFYRVMTGIYSFGAQRPGYIAPRVFGKAFENCLRFSDWGKANKSLTAIAQSITCLRLIDPDFDVSELLSEVIPYQRPDGSFPPRCSWSDQEQDFGTGVHSTLAAVAALHLVTYNRWRAAPPSQGCTHPIRTCRDQIAARLTGQLPEIMALKVRDRLMAATIISRATGQDGFSLLGLQGYVPSRADMRQLTLRLAGFPQAAGHAHRTLTLDAALQDLLALAPRASDDPRLPAALLYLQAQQVSDPPSDLLQAWDQAAIDADDASFLHYCNLALLHQSAMPGDRIKSMALHLAQREQRAFLARPRASLTELLQRLERLSLLAMVFEQNAQWAVAA